MMGTPGIHSGCVPFTTTSPSAQPPAWHTNPAQQHVLSSQHTAWCHVSIISDIIYTYFRYYCTHVGPGVAAAGAGVGSGEGAAGVAQVAAGVLVRAQLVLRPAVATCVQSDTAWTKACEALGVRGIYGPFLPFLASFHPFMPCRPKAK